MRVLKKYFVSLYLPLVRTMENLAGWMSDMVTLFSSTASLSNSNSMRYNSMRYNIIVSNIYNIKMVRVMVFSATANLSKNMWGKKPIRWTLNHSRKLVGK